MTVQFLQKSQKVEDKRKYGVAKCAAKRGIWKAQEVEQRKFGKELDGEDRKEQCSELPSPSRL